MTLNVNTLGFINFDEKYNKVLASGAVTVSVSHQVKDANGEAHNEYVNAIIPKKFVPEIKPLIGKLAIIEGVIEHQNVEKGKGYLNMTIFKATEFKKKDDVTDVDLPF